MGKKALICVDDERIVLVSLKAQLKKEFGDEYHIETAESGDEAAEIIDELMSDGYQVPLVISDQIMPGMKGVDLLIHIHQKLPDTRTIMLTGQADADAVGMAINKANLFRYIAKPWDETDLCMTVKEALKSFDMDRTIDQQNKELQALVIQLKEYNENLENIVRQRTREVELQRDRIQTANKELTDSIIYASLIQQAVLPSADIVGELFPDFFIFNRPRNIVSGDFYWFHRVDNKLCVVVADCTGHGVPGAFMSMLGIALLNEMAGKLSVLQANKVLNEMRRRIKKSFQTSQTKDGIDIALCIIDTQTLKMQYAGAFNPIYIIRNEQGSLVLKEIKADRFPLGSHPKDTVSFTTNEFQLEEDDAIYMFSDGYVSQFGGPRQETFRSTRFKETLMAIQSFPMTEQKELLIKEIELWQGATDQIDDMLIVGIKIPNLQPASDQIYEALEGWDASAYSLGIDEIDAQHKYLFSLFKQLFNSISTHSNQETLGELLQSLVEYADIHFATEEHMLGSIHYPGYDDHLKEHRFFKNQLGYLMDVCTRHEANMTNNLLNFLKNWLVNHIEQVDMKYKPFLSKPSDHPA